MTMIEKVAKALFNQYPAGSSWETCGGTWNQHYINMARAAIEAMREPSEKMIDAAGRGSQFPPYILDTKGKYQAMINEALKE